MCQYLVSRLPIIGRLCYIMCKMPGRVQQLKLGRNLQTFVVKTLPLKNALCIYKKIPNVQGSYAAKAGRSRNTYESDHKQQSATFGSGFSSSQRTKFSLHTAQWFFLLHALQSDNYHNTYLSLGSIDSWYSALTVHHSCFHNSPGGILYSSSSSWL